MIYQLMFAIITPALISGAFAERMKFSAMLLFTVLWSTDRLFPDGAHGVGQGRPAECVPGRQDSLLRFRGRHGGAHHVGRLARWCARSIWASAIGFPREADEAAQPGAQRDRRVPAVGGLVRLQRGQRAWPHPAWPPAPSSRPILAPRRPLWAGCSRNGFKHGKPSMLGGISGAWRDWSPSRRPPVS